MIGRPELNEVAERSREALRQYEDGGPGRRRAGQWLDSVGIDHDAMMEFVRDLHNGAIETHTSPEAELMTVFHFGWIAATLYADEIGDST